MQRCSQQSSLVENKETKKSCCADAKCHQRARNYSFALFGLREFPNFICFFHGSLSFPHQKKSGHGLREHRLSAAKPHLAEP